MVKKALLFGFNYSGSGCALSGCWNDAKNMKAFLLTKGYSEENITLVTDDPSPSTDPGLASARCTTKDQMMHYFLDFIENVKSGDHLFIHYSGHGGQLPDHNKDEKDGMDECIYSPDLQSISDDDLRKVLVDSLPGDVTLVTLFDCCHSGTILDLPYTKSRNGYTVENTKSVKNNVFCISACLDTQTAADTSFDRMPQGALTHGFLEAVKMVEGKGTWVGLMDHIIQSTRYFPQRAQLSYSKNLADFDKMF